MSLLLNPASLFLARYLELRSLLPGTLKWNAEKLMDNPPRYYRVLSAQACLKALGYEDVELPKFIYDRKINPISDELQKRIESLLQAQFNLNYEDYISERDTFDANHFFRSFLSIRSTLYGLDSIQNSVLVASGHYLTPYMTITALKEKLDPDIQVIDSVILLLLNPEGRMFTRQELIDCFDFPDVDIDEIDADWI